jgi:hypothetical protein
MSYCSKYLNEMVFYKSIYIIYNGSSMEKIGYLKEVAIERIGRIKPADEDGKSGYKVEVKAYKGRY